MFKRLALKFLNLYFTNKFVRFFVSISEGLISAYNIIFHLSLIYFVYNYDVISSSVKVIWLFCFVGAWASLYFSFDRTLYPKFINRLYIWANYGDVNNLIKNYSIVPKDSEDE